MTNLGKSIIAGIVFTLAMTGCRHHVTTAKTPQFPPEQAPAPAATLTVNPATVEHGQSAQLSWSTSNAATVNIDGIGAVAPTGSRTITPGESTTYHLSAKGAGGVTEATARVVVNPAAVSKGPEITEEKLFAQNVKDIFFNYDNADILPNEKTAISGDLDFLARHSHVSVIIEGHCDERGSEEYNMSLGESRAEQVKAALVRGGISADRIKIISYGKERPFCSSAENESCWQQNRRAHFALALKHTAAN